jgi:hypothetical protein
MMQLSKAQSRVLQLLQEGWELGVSSGIVGNAWLQKNGLGRGGETEFVNYNTFHSLYKRGLIKVEKRKGDPFYLTRYILT